MSEKKRQKKDGEDKNKNNQREKVIREINEPGERNPTSERTQNPNYK